MSDDAGARKSATVAQFNRVATDFDSEGTFAHYGRRLVELVGVGPGQRVLDVATGRGAVLFPAAEKVGASGEVAGIDLAEGMVQAANELAAQRGLSVRVRAMDAEHLGFPDAAFDRVLCGFGIMFFPHLDQAMGEFRRVLKSTGRIGVSTWRTSPGDHLRTVLDELDLLGSNDWRPPGWITDPDVLADALTGAGFRNVRVIADPLSFVFADVEQYWQSIRGNLTRRVAEGLDPAQQARARAALHERFRAFEQPDGIHVTATALLGVGNR